MYACWPLLPGWITLQCLASRGMPAPAPPSAWCTQRERLTLQTSTNRLPWLLWWSLRAWTWTGWLLSSPNSPWWADITGTITHREAALHKPRVSQQAVQQQHHTHRLTSFTPPVFLIELLVQTVVLEGGGGRYSSETRELQDPPPGDYSQDGTSLAEIYSETGKREF